MLGLSVDVVRPLEVGVKYNPNLKQIDESTAWDNGRHWVGLGQYFIRYPTSLQMLIFDDNDGDRDAGTLHCWTKEGQDITMSLTALVRLEKDHAVRRYRRYKDEWKRVLVWNLQSAVKQTTVKFFTTEFYNNRKMIHGNLTEAIRDALESEDVELHSVQMLTVALATDFENAVKEKVVEQQGITTTLTQRNKTLINRETDLIRANADWNVTVLVETAVGHGAVLSASAEAERLVVKQEARTSAYDRLRTVLQFSYEQLAQYIWATSLESFSSGSQLYVGFSDASSALEMESL